MRINILATTQVKTFLRLQLADRKLAGDESAGVCNDKSAVEGEWGVHWKCIPGR